ncbi:hypothetical protein ET445_06635 [Agromyces protaetiae]|uniref:Uncharacterized protein n=1 Tax=Agromyces protaetiae TaxID=2509455 RepID=A0A4P6FB55_9MICO|nr:hypothetical protein [Agromyces protaetiae]QAY73074.1 hypothetical protein ET445_06635 [Agromyces protaetiae]
MADFRGERMPSPEGEGRAKNALEAAWTAYFKANKAINKRIFGAFPELREMLRGQTGARVLDLMGFWFMWQACGGFEGTQRALGISRAQMYKRIALFRQAFGEHPDVSEFPGVTIDPAEFAVGLAEKVKNAQKD